MMVNWQCIDGSGHDSLTYHGLFFYIPLSLYAIIHNWSTQPSSGWFGEKKENEQNYRIEKDILFPFTNETFCECHTIVNIKDLVWRGLEETYIRYR